MPISQDLLEILCCPATKTPVVMLSEEKLAKVNEKISAGGVQRVDGQPVEEPLQEGLITEDGKTIYRITDDIPIMLTGEGIDTEQLGEL